jgi:hypothetical protein
LRLTLANFGIDEDTSKLKFLVCFLDLKFVQCLVRERANFNPAH